MPFPVPIVPRRMTTGEKQTASQLYPNLDVDNVWVLGEATGTYNCLAWTLGITDAWIWPWSSSEAVTKTKFDQLYSHYGDTVAASAAGGITAYGRADDDMTHGSVNLDVVQTPADEEAPVGVTWTSKRGANILITHAQDGLEDPSATAVYGTIRQFYNQNRGPSVTE